MWVQPFRSAETEVFPRRESEDRKVAVLLNANARRVSKSVVRSLSHVIAEDDLFVSRSELDCRRIAQTVVDRRYHTVFLGGGDGTFTGFVNEILNQVDLRRRHHATRAPRFGVLKLGTGNSVAALVKASGGDGILDDVLRARAGEVPGYRTVDMLDVDGRLAPFAGLGVDGKLLNDYIAVKNTFGKGMMSGLFSGELGYVTSVALKTAPYYLAHSTYVDCEVWNGKATAAFRLGPDGMPLGEPIAPGALIYRGKLMIAAAGTMPYYGFGLKIFPFAGKRRGMMNLRLGTLPAAKILANLPGLWKGTWFPEGLYDFHAREVTIKFARPMPLQISGDAEGYRDQVRFGVSPEPIELVDFTGTVN